MWRIVSYLRDWYLERKGVCPAVDAVIFVFVFAFNIIRNCNAK
jgi:sulfur relay (sulfurtransferase) DsrC/TusE family protein